MKMNFSIFLISVLLVSSCIKDEKGETMLSAEVISSRIMTGFDDARKLITQTKNVDHSTVAIMKNGVTVCTGTTFGLSHVITAAHCVYDINKKELVEDLTVSPGLHLGRSYRPAPRFKIKRVFILKRFINELRGKGYTTLASSKDIAVIQILEYKGYKNFSDFSPELGIGSSESLDLFNESFNTIAYTVNSDKEKDSQYYQINCRPRGKRGQYDAFYHNCDSGPTSSGMGLLVGSVLKGIHAGGVPSKGLNSAAMITDPILSELMKIKSYDFDNLNLFEIFKEMPEPYFGLTLYNNCHQDIEVYAGYRGLDNHLYVSKKMVVKAGQYNLTGVKSKEENLYIHGNAVDGRFSWRGDYRFPIDGEKKNFFKVNIEGVFMDKTVQFNCDD